MLARLDVALRTYENVEDAFDKVMFVSPAMLFTADATKRPKLLQD